MGRPAPGRDSRRAGGNSIVTIAKSSININNVTRKGASRRPDRGGVLVNNALIMGRDGNRDRMRVLRACAPIRYETDEVRKPGSSNSHDQRGHARAQCSAHHSPDLAERPT